MANYSRIADFFHEAGQLKRVARSGWWHALVDRPESVAEHSYRTAVIAYALAKLENSEAFRKPKTKNAPGTLPFDANKLAVAALFHDFPEARILDLHKISAKYLPGKKQAQQAALADQQKGLPFGIGFKLSTKEQQLLSDADQLEMAFQAREYFDAGHKLAWKWVESAASRLRSRNSKLILQQLKKQDAASWWRSIK